MDGIDPPAIFKVTSSYILRLPSFSLLSYISFISLSNGSIFYYVRTLGITNECKRYPLASVFSVPDLAKLSENVVFFVISQIPEMFPKPNRVFFIMSKILIGRGNKRKWKKWKVGSILWLTSTSPPAGLWRHYCLLISKYLCLGSQGADTEGNLLHILKMPWTWSYICALLLLRLEIPFNQSTVVLNLFASSISLQSFYQIKAYFTLWHMGGGR